MQKNIFSSVVYLYSLSIYVSLPQVIDTILLLLLLHGAVHLYFSDVQYILMYLLAVH